MATPIEDTLVKATKVEAKPDEPRKKFLARVVRAAAQLPDESWKALPNDAQVWVNAAGKAMNAKIDLPDFDVNVPAFMVQHKLQGYEKFASAAPATPAPTPAAQPSAPATSAATPATPASPAAASTPAAPTSAPAAGGEKKKGGTAFFRRVSVEHPDWDQKQCLEATHAAGFPVTVNTAAITFYEARATMKLLAETGGLTPEVKAKVDSIKPKVRTPPPPRPKKAATTTGAAPADSATPVEAPSDAASSVPAPEPVGAAAGDDE